MQELSPAQFDQVMGVLKAIAEGLKTRQSYTIAGADDWQFIVGFVLVFAGFIGFVWRDLKSDFRQYRLDNDADHERLRQAQKNCQDLCCNDK